MIPLQISNLIKDHSFYFSQHSWPHFPYWVLNLAFGFFQKLCKVGYQLLTGLA